MRYTLVCMHISETTRVNLQIVCASVCVCLCVDHDCEPCKTAEPIWRLSRAQEISEPLLFVGLIYTA